eukprot:TRINITY_DN31335_c0_g4_i2.p1 TRINITY_DN31335_c0_g4~~TRINITY_DN31335_c0_g4_i2.p1  ORF type:complete len:681 (+),score=0.28 TRINITY_DN31335_c0_g4_i2:53-2044(+)
MALRPAYGAAGRALRAADLEDADDGRTGRAGGAAAGGSSGTGAPESSVSALSAGAASDATLSVSEEATGGAPGGGGASPLSVASSSGAAAPGEVRWFTFAELALATNEFGRSGQRNVLGAGRFGTVYRARLVDGGTVAVKRLMHFNPDQSPREFRFEVQSLAALRHPNLAAILGACCADAAECGTAALGSALGDSGAAAERMGERMLVTEYAANGSLDTWLHPTETAQAASGQPETIDWLMRMHVAVGCARGLAYLHGLKVVHADVRARNVLLDAQWHAKLADYGAARIVGRDPKQAIARHALQSFGYVAPEYANSGVLTERSDVYSFGVLLLELVAGRRPIDNHLPPEQVDVVRWVKRMAAEERTAELVDPRIASSVAADDIDYVVGIALRCIEANALKRPRMKQIVHMLESEDPSMRGGWVAKRPSPASAKALRDSSPTWYNRAGDSPAAPSSAMAPSVARASPRAATCSPRFGGNGGVGGSVPGRTASDVLRAGSPRHMVGMGGHTGSSPKAADIGGMIASAAMKATAVGGSPRHMGYSPTKGGVPGSPTASARAAAGGGRMVGASPPKVSPYMVQGGSPSAARLAGGVGVGTGGLRGGSPGGAGYRSTVGGYAGSSPRAAGGTGGYGGNAGSNAGGEGIISSQAMSITNARSLGSWSRR